MYWVIFFIFLLTALAPFWVREEVFGIEQQAFETLLFLLGGFFLLLLYLRKNRQYRRILREHRVCRREMRDASRDLTSTYAYIGEVNRKVDILRDVILHLSSSAPSEKMFFTILEALSIFSGSDFLYLEIVDREEKHVLQSFSSKEGWKPSLDEQKLWEKNREKKVIEVPGRYLIRAPRTLRGYRARLLIKKNTLRQKDVEILQALTAQALFLYVLIHYQEKDL